MTDEIITTKKKASTIKSVPKSFSLTPVNLGMLGEIVETYGFMSDSAAIQSIIVDFYKRMKANK